MTSNVFRNALIVVVIGALVSVPMLSAQPSATGHVNSAIEHGKAGHADVATKHAESAVTHLSQAPHSAS